MVTILSQSFEFLNTLSVETPVLHTQMKGVLDLGWGSLFRNNLWRLCGPESGSRVQRDPKSSQNFRKRQCVHCQAVQKHTPVIFTKQINRPSTTTWKIWFWGCTVTTWFQCRRLNVVGLRIHMSSEALQWRQPTKCGMHVSVEKCLKNRADPFRVWAFLFFFGSPPWFPLRLLHRSTMKCLLERESVCVCRSDLALELHYG